MEAHSFARSDGGLTLPRSRKLLVALRDERLVAQLRRGNEAAFEVLYDRHHAAVLSYCRHMLGSRDEAEDALQQAFISAHADIVSTEKPIRFKAWIFTIARNRCLSILRARREQPTDDLERVSTAGLSDEVQHRADLKELLGDMQELPDDQRTALILSELGDLSHAEVAEVIGCEVAKVKSLVFQARTGLMERRQARETPCEEIRDQLATLRGGSLRRGPLRRHLKACPGCSEFREEVRRQRQMVAAVLPVVPTLALRESALAAVGISTASAGGGLLAAGGGGAVVAAKAGAAKIAVLAAATTGTVGGAIAIDQTVVEDSHRDQAAQSQSAGDIVGTDRATEVARDGSAVGGTGPADPEVTSDGRAGEKGGVGAERANGFSPVQGEANGERAKHHARARVEQKRMEERQVAHGGMNPRAGPKPKQQAAPGQPQTSGPKEDKPKPERQPDLIPLLPATPDLTPPKQETPGSQVQNPRGSDEDEGEPEL